VVRTQIQLPESLHRRLKGIARLRGVSLAEVIRELLDHGLGCGAMDRKALYGRASRLVGAFRADVDDLSSAHDRHLGDTYG
jgi:hypothetical protein